MANVPSVAVEALAEQVGLLPLALAASLQGYPASEDTRLDHHERLRLPVVITADSDVIPSSAEV